MANSEIIGAGQDTARRAPKKLEDIGFYTLSDSRALQSSECSPLWRCELILTDKCNFKCTYCRGLRNDISGEMPFETALYTVRQWIKEGLQNVRFSGGEPTLYARLNELVSECKNAGVKRIAVSTNGSASQEKYLGLIKSGANDFSVSLDACCSSVADRMSGGINGAWFKVVENIKWLSSQTYTTVGIVVNNENIDKCLDTILFADTLGVSDIRVIPSAQFNKMLLVLEGLSDCVLSKYPILNYRASNIRDGRHVRGLTEKDCGHCRLVLDDMAVAAGFHFPCIIYMREQGNAIGKIGPNMREERKEWSENHDCLSDPICSKNCLDVCIDFNNKANTRTSCAKAKSPAQDAVEICHTAPNT
jgi:sulfatase maturation enzyme AslB (radical SAM superfamily)